MCSIFSRNILNAGRSLYTSTYILIHAAKNLRGIELKNSYSSDEKLNNISANPLYGNHKKHNLTARVDPEYEVFRDEDADTIFDVDEEQKKLDIKTINALEQKAESCDELNMKHGVNGVFEIVDLVEILRRDRAQNIFVAAVPIESSYVDYIVIVTGRTHRHMGALATYIRKVYKLKRYPGESLPKIEGEKSKDWIAIDLGNIALHIFSTEAREKYDLEMLWSVGLEYDKVMHNVDYDTEVKDRYNEFLAGFQPANELESHP